MNFFQARKAHSAHIEDESLAAEEEEAERRKRILF